jgi:competence protein ComEA
MGRFSFVCAVCVLMLSVAPTATPAQKKSAKPGNTTAVTTPVNINTATAAQLEVLPGLGPKTAQLIVEHRQKSGGFKKIEELMNIKGIGEKSFLKLKPMITVGGEKTDGPDGKL